ncbi:GntR family transcriptional regulator [Pigmentiphaga litoralis]|uniref:GntR family transcriptional regulator n=1 Tax=Pigmentiphaga litoralis TaxID=516702 RepID=UPI003B42FC49
MDTALLHAPDAATLDEPTTDPVARVVGALEEDIVLGVLNPRERLIEDELMHRFGIKRHVVREVLAMLDRLGLTERRRNIGSLVRSFTPKEVSELYQLRALLETQAASLIPQSPDPDALNELVDIQEAHDAAVQANDPRRVFRANVRFHQALFGLTGNVVLQRAIAEYARQTHPIRFSSLVSPDYRQKACREHWQMIAALKAGDRDTLVTLCREHLLPSRDAYLSANQHRFGPP